MVAPIISDMGETLDRDSLLRASSIVDRLAVGWRPGDAELENARFVDDWTIFPSGEGMPFRLMGLAWSLPVKCTMIVASVIAINPTEGWARIWDEWVVIGDPIDEFHSTNCDTIQRAGASWLLTQLRRRPISS
jgi:hypothetical protein